MVYVASFNVCGVPSRLAPFVERASRFCPELERSELDVVAFQEVWGPGALGVLRSRLPSFPFVAWRRGVGGLVAGGLVVFSRRPVGAVSYHSLRGVRPAAGGPLFRVTRAVNSALQGVLVVDVGGLVLATTHLTANRDGDWSAGNRHFAFQREQVVRLRAIVRTAGVKVLTGDFNLASDGPLYPLVVEGWLDPFAGTDPATYHVELLPPGSVGRRIDYLLVDGPVDGGGLLFTGTDAGMYLSDHVALTVRTS